MPVLPQAAAAKVLCKELAKLRKEPVEGFRIVNVDDHDVYEWTVAVFGPPGTPYEGGCFKALIKFGCEYPFQPPTFRFLSKIWHPNIYENGEVCISILHPSTNQAQGGELPEERWNPTQGVRTVIMSIISLLNEPNTFSPANVDASVMFRDFKTGKSQKYAEFCSKCVLTSQIEARQSGIPIPRNIDDYIIIGSLEYNESNMSVSTLTSPSSTVVNSSSHVSSTPERRASNQSWDFELDSQSSETNIDQTSQLSEGDATNSRGSSAVSRDNISSRRSSTDSGDALFNQVPGQMPDFEDMEDAF